MIRKANECTVNLREHMRGGEGTIEITNFVTPDELNNKGRLYARLTIHPGCSIGYHMHETDSEIFYIMKGTAEYDDNGEKRSVSAGDVTVCPAGTGHGISNTSSEDVELIAVIVYA